MIKGIGIDLVEIKRIKQSLQRYNYRFIKRVYTAPEIEYCESKVNKYQHYAVRFAGKEALFKAMGSGLRNGISWQDIEFINDELGKPQPNCGGKLAQLIDQLGVNRIFVSFSHTADFAVAIVVLEA